MLTEGHRKFGRAVVEEFELSEELVEWAVAPDYGYLFSKPEGNKIIHRWTVHGLSNVDKCIDLLKDKDQFYYREELNKQIETLIVSHNFLDLFNFIIHPSYPKNRKFKYIPDQTKRLWRVGWEDPYDLDILFSRIVKEYETVEELGIKMIEEYNLLPKEKGHLVKWIEAWYKEKHPRL